MSDIETRAEKAEAERDRLVDLLAACPQGIEGHSCCDCPSLEQAQVTEALRVAYVEWENGNVTASALNRMEAALRGDARNNVITVTLTETELDELCLDKRAVPAVERIIAARVAEAHREALKRIVWLPDAWERGPHRSAEDCADALRAALIAPEATP